MEVPVSAVCIVRYASKAASIFDGFANRDMRSDAVLMEDDRPQIGQFWALFTGCYH